LLLAFLFLSVVAARGATTPLDAERIKSALQTTTLEEDGFVDRALEMVAEGKLSAKLVRTTFVWARKQQQHKFQHFRRGLLLRVSDPAIRAELAHGQPSPTSPPPNFGEALVGQLRRLFSFLPSVRVLLK